MNDLILELMLLQNELDYRAKVEELAIYYIESGEYQKALDVLKLID